MPTLLPGLALWYAGHFFKRLLPGPRARLGDAGRAVAALLILAGVVLMVVGYRGWDAPQIWYPPAWTLHLNNLLVLVAFYLFAASGVKSRVATRLRHPQLGAVKAWATAHLLVNGDLASIVLFGGLLAWAILEVITINRAQPEWTAPAWRGPAAEVKAVVGTLVAFALVALIHDWLGYRPIPG